LTLSDLGISKDIAAAGMKLLALTPEEIDAKAVAATEKGADFSCKKCVSEIRDEQQSAKRDAEKAEAKKRRKAVDGLYLGDFREIGHKIPDASVDLIFTDPPYDRKAIVLYDGLGEFAARVLRPGGSLIAYVGHIQLPDVLTDLSKHLRYWWTCGCFHAESKARMTEYGIVAGWKPIVWFVKETRGDKQTFITDVVTGAREKSHHDWQQAVSEARYFIDLLTQPDDFVVDPFCGGGTTPVACIQSGRKWASCEIDEANFANASSRIKEVMDDQAIQ
jgi:23S rRNA G2445 N2-methylase RlmL